MGLILSVRRKLVLYLALILIAQGDLFAQDPHFSQFFANPVYTNPAFAGGSNHGRAVLNARNQWSGIAGTFTTVNAAYDEHFDAINGGIGVLVTRDEQGTGLLTTNSLSLAYSYMIPVNKRLTFRAAIQAGVSQKSIEFNNFVWGDQILKSNGIVKPQTSQPATEPTVFFPNFAAGFIAYTKRFYGGFAIHNMLEPNQGFYSTNSPVLRRYTANAGIQIPLGSESRNIKNNSSLSPNILFMQQGPDFSELNLGMYYNRGYYVLGVYYRQTARNGDAAIFLLGLRREKLRIGVSYDATLSQARKGTGGTYEVSLAFELRKKTRTKSPRVIRCPEF